MNADTPFDELYHAYAPRVYRLCMGYAGGRDAIAREWVQETFIKVWKHRQSFKGDAAIATWIYRIAVNVCLSDLRKKPKTEGLNQSIPDQPEPDREQEQPSQDTRIAKLYTCIDQLTEKNKMLILLELEEVPQQEIAATTGLKHGAVRTRLLRIRKALLNCMTYGT
ncbi:RNA polymerase sigma factor [Leeuwenhoekiella marinoflava]|uniref:RNA polymerase sigma-70 factor (ECF subfamily) n=2 Tax=Leeuwenhoekiella marinoflava TaxID=988 RepID=A0A4Q0PNC5_9FLAO|nr:sigma-70 family RNA polymerase sigma factor [Leeuwenhoekiella marinoflava]RXG29867.1 RNA polymerase sigma-70 factor (ECF subfamily) [Leeuwenhoekiella marinoflava]SHF27836.1 RNA polymerase sigma-70 factor, ECF subfamily [Leeuwenhoekiella marinoflava DSM 3653]